MKHCKAGNGPGDEAISSYTGSYLHTEFPSLIRVRTECLFVLGSKTKK